MSGLAEPGARRGGADALPGLRISFALRPNRLFALACAAFAALTVLNALAVAVYRPDNPGIERMTRIFLFAMEASFPMLFNYLLLLGNGFVLILAALRAYGTRDPWRLHWLGVAAIFLFLAYDEAAQFHQTLIPALRTMSRSDNPLIFGLVLATAAAGLAVAVAYARFLLALPFRIGAIFAVAGALYLAGAVGMEIAAGDRGGDGRAALLLGTLEETLEMAGLILFGYGLLRFLARPDGRVGLHIDA